VSVLTTHMTLEVLILPFNSLEPAPISPHDISSPAWNLLVGSAKSTWTTSPQTKGEDLFFAPGLAIGNTDTSESRALAVPWRQLFVNVTSRKISVAERCERSCSSCTSWMTRTNRFVRRFSQTGVSPRTFIASDMPGSKMAQGFTQ
jgi:hypothetical protein